LAVLYPGRIGNINLYTPFNTSNYNSLQTQLRRQLGKTGQFGLSYTYSKAISFADNNDSGLSWNRPEDWARNRAPASFDRPHNVQTYFVYDLPFGKGKKWATTGPANWLLGGWQTNGILSLMSGTPFTVGSAGTSVNAQGNAQTADQVKGSAAISAGLIRMLLPRSPPCATATWAATRCADRACSTWTSACSATSR
jgi:outer membrane usher protein FimD/PapC